jgi:sulfide:quinone oxidoreductase
VSKPVVLVAGGGIAGLEAVLALHHFAPDAADVRMLAPEPEFVYKPLVVEEPFTATPAVRHELEPMLAEVGAGLVPGALRSVDAERHHVELGDGRTVSYDYLVVCVGGRARRAYTAAESFWSSDGDLPVDDLITRASASPERTLALIVPPGTSWPLPLYEMGLQIRRRADELGIYALRISLYTPEDRPLLIFGTAASQALGELLAARAIDVYPSASVFENADGCLCSRPGKEAIEASVALALPVITGPAVAGLPADEHGFAPVDEFGRVRGVPDVYAAGDGTDFPVKQGGLATQQADAVAAHVASRLGADVEPAPFEPVLRGQLITGGESLNMRQPLGGGEGEGLASLDYLWWPPQKVAGRFLTAYLARTTPQPDLEPPVRPLEVEVAIPHEWHGELGSFDAEITSPN